MEKTLSDTLAVLGLDKLSIRFYLAVIKNGPASIPEVATSAHIKRSTAYLLSKQLLDKGLLLEDHKEYANRIYAVDPKKLLQQVSAKGRLLRRQELELEEQLPQIRALFQSSQIRPKIQVFEGNSGLLQIWQDILSSKTEILLWTNQQTENQFFNTPNHDKFISQRVAKKISIKVLATDSPESRKLIESDTTSLRSTRILPKDTTFSAETYIYDNKVANLDYDKDIYGVIIESSPIFTSHKSIFNLTWNLLK